MKKIDEIVESYPDTELMYASGGMGYDLDKAIVGVDPFEEKIVYSIQKSIDIIKDDFIASDIAVYGNTQKNESDYTIEAMEYFEFNIRSAYVGEHTPLWIDDTVSKPPKQEEYVSYSQGFINGLLVTSGIWLAVVVLVAIFTNL